MNENPRSNIAWEHRLAWFKKFTGIQNLGWNWSRANWIRVEYLPRIHHIAAQPRSSRFTVEIGWKTRKFYRTDYLRVDVQRHLMGSTDNKKECESNAQLVSLFAKKDLEQVKCHSSDLDQRKWYCMGADSPQGEWDRVAEKMLIHYCADLETMYNCSSHDYFCKTAQSLRSSRRNVWINESYQDRTGRPVVGGQSSSSFVPSVIKTNVPLNNDDPLHIKNFYCKDAENELKSYHNKTEWANCVRMHYSWLLLKSDSISWRKTLKNFHISQIQWPVVSTPCQERKVHLNRRIRGITKIRPVLEVTTCCLQG